MLSNCSFKLKVPDYLMCNLERSGTFTKKPDFVNLTMLLMEVPYEIVCHVFFVVFFKSWEFLSDILVTSCTLL